MEAQTVPFGIKRRHGPSLTHMKNAEQKRRTDKMKCVHCSPITMKAEEMGLEEADLDAPSLQKTILYVAFPV